MANLRKKERSTLINSAYELTKSDIDLADIEAAFIEQCHSWLLMITDPVVTFVPIDAFVHQMKQMTDGTADTTTLKNNVLHMFHNDPSFANAYRGDIVVKFFKNGRSSFGSNNGLMVGLHESHRIYSRLITMMPHAFKGHEHNVERFTRVLLAFVRNYRIAHHAMIQAKTEKEIKLEATRQARSQVVAVLSENGVNTKYGSLAIVCKKYLAVIAPGQGTQRKKIIRARGGDADTMKFGSCVSELNPPEQGLLSYVMGTLHVKLNKDETFQSAVEPKHKRQRLQSLTDEIIDAVQPLIQINQEGLKEEAILRKVYNPMEWARVQGVVVA